MKEEAISPILTEYDELLNAMQNQIDLYKSEHHLLRTEIIKLLTQNQDLSHVADGEFQRKLETDFSIEINPIINSEMVRNLRRQLELSLLERKQLNEMFQTSQKEIAQLRRQADRSNEPAKLTWKQDAAISAMESKLEDLSLELKMEKSVREDQESVRIKAQTEAAKLRVLLEDKTENYDELDKRRRDVENKYKVLDQECIVLRATLECVCQSRDDLEAGLANAEKRIAQLQAQCEEAKAKVEEALEVAERAVTDRDVSVSREIQLQAEVCRLEQYILQAADEANKKLNAKMEEMESGFNSTLTKTKESLKETEQLLLVKNLELEKVNRHCQQLELALAERKINNQHFKEFSAEIQDLQSRYESNERQLKETQKALRNVLDENDKLIDELKVVAQREEQIRSQLSEFEKKAEGCRCERLAEKLKHVKAQKNDLGRQLDKQLDLNGKWEKESEKLVQMLEERSKKSFKATEKLRLRNKQLTLMLQEAKISQPSIMRV